MTSLAFPSAAAAQTGALSRARLVGAACASAAPSGTAWRCGAAVPRPSSSPMSSMRIARSATARGSGTETPAAWRVRSISHSRAIQTPACTSRPKALFFASARPARLGRWKRQSPSK